MASGRLVLGFLVRCIATAFLARLELLRTISNNTTCSWPYWHRQVLNFLLRANFMFQLHSKGCYFTGLFGFSLPGMSFWSSCFNVFLVSYLHGFPPRDAVTLPEDSRVQDDQQPLVLIQVGIV